MGSATKAAGRRNGFPAGYKRLSPIARESWLAGEECRGLVLEGKLHQTQVEAERRRILKDTDRVRRLAPSPTIVEDAQRGSAFPPASESCPMLRADVVLDPVGGRCIDRIGLCFVRIWHL